MAKFIVLVTSSFPIRADGSEAAGSFVADLVEELAKDVDVRVVAPGPTDTRERWSEHVEIFRYAAPAKPLSTLKPWRPLDLLWLARVWRGGLEATRTATADGAAHVIALWGLPCGEWARCAARERGVVYSVWMLGSDVWTLGRLPIARGLLARVIRQAAHAYADGFRLAEDARRISGTPVAFLPSTRKIRLSRPPPPRANAPYRLLFLGRWHPNKGVDLLLDALATLSDAEWRNIELVDIQGGGPLDSFVRKRVAALRSAGRPVEAGRFLSKPDAEAAIARSDWILIPSRIESIPVMFSDAMKLGRPVLATAVGDLERLLTESRAGFVAGSATAEDFATVIKKSLSASAAEIATATVCAAEQFDLSRVAGRLLASEPMGIARDINS
jgi:glycosyltransferase involved in cell wall biosynthesis